MKSLAPITSITQNNLAFIYNSSYPNFQKISDDGQNSLKYSSHDHLYNSDSYDEIVIIEEDDDLIMPKPTKKQKSEFNGTLTSIPSRKTVQKGYTKSMLQSYSKLHTLSIPLISAQNHFCLKEQGQGEVDPRKRLCRTQSFSNDVSSLLVKASALHLTNIKQFPPLNFDWSLGVSTDSYFTSSTNTSVTSPLAAERSAFDFYASDTVVPEISDGSNKKENLVLDVASQHPMFRLDDIQAASESNGIKDDSVESVYQMQLQNIVSIPNLDVTTCKGQRIKRTLRSIWKPDCIDHGVLNDCLSRICQLTGQIVTNEEKLVKLLMRFGMDVEEVVKEVQKNQAFYKNYFKSEYRILRSRIPLF